MSSSLPPSNTPLLYFDSSLFPFFPPSGSTLPNYIGFLSFLLSAAAMFLHRDEPVQFPCPLETMMLTESEIQDLFSLINQPEVDPASPSSASSSRTVYSAEERKLRRMQSNRESARRSRCKRKKHLEKLTSQVNRLKVENHEMKNLLAFSMQQHFLLSLHNDELRSESMTLLAKLSDLCGILGTMLSQ